MLKTRIIPCLDVKDGRVVKGVNFVELRDAGEPVEQAKLYDAQGADELCFLDITATSDNRGVLYDVISSVAEQCFMPLTVGGGVRTLDDIRKLLLAGADKVAINSAAVNRPEFVREAAQKFGSQCIVVAIDAKEVQDSEQKDAGGQQTDQALSAPHGAASRQAPEEIRSEPSASEAAPHVSTDRCATGVFKIFTHGGRKETGIDAISWAKKMADYGAGEILLTSMDRDGTKQGVNLELTKAVSEAVSIPVIASGGIGKLEHFAQAIKEGKADAILAASVFHFGEMTIAEVKNALHQANIPTRN